MVGLYALNQGVRAGVGSPDRAAKSIPSRVAHLPTAAISSAVMGTEIGPARLGIICSRIDGKVRFF